MKNHFFQLQNLNARLTLNVLHILHASKRNVKILVSLLFVGWMQNAEQTITGHSVYVALDLLEIHTLFVKNVSI